MSASTSIHSNAFNFMDFLASQVDPRTGQYTCAISLPELKANNLCGPIVPLQLNFNPLNNRDSGFGTGWNLQLSQFDPASGVLSLYTGESFKVVLGGPVPLIPEKKLDSFHFHEQVDNGRKSWRVEHKSGLVEILQVGQGYLAVPIEMRSPQGHHVTFGYSAFGTDPLLSSISNADGTQLLSLARTASTLSLKLHPGTAFEALFVMNIIGGETRSLVLPTDDQASWRFDYVLNNSLTCLKQVWTPTGGHETVTYSGAPHYFPGADRRSLPRVETHVRDPGFNQPAIVVNYAYDKTGANFLGYGSGVSWTDDGLDNLYKDGVTKNYTYETTETLWDAPSKKAIRNIRRVYNRAHLQVLEETTQYSNNPDEDAAFYLVESAYYFDPTLDFRDQKPYCQLPKTVTQTWRYLSATLPRHPETTTTTYDNSGNLLAQTRPDGITETNEWYLAAGETGCPPDPQGFVRNLKSSTVTPATSEYGEAPTLRTRYRYDDYQGLGGNGKWLALQDETVSHWVEGQAQAELRCIAHTYYDAPTNPQLHGLMANTSQTLHGQLDTCNTSEYSYQVIRDEASGAEALRTVTTLIGFDDTIAAPIRRVVTLEHSLLNGMKLSSHDADDTHAVYRYDRLGRVTLELAAPGTPYEALREYRYALTNGNVPGQQAMQSVKDVKGGETRTWLDGFNRGVREERMDVDALGANPSAFRATWSALYDNREQLVVETTVDWLDADNIALRRSFEYNVWSEQYKVTGPDGVVQVTNNDPATQTLTARIEVAGLAVQTTATTRTRLNRFGKQNVVETLDADNKVISTRRYLYDGLGNCVEQIDEMGNSTQMSYDLFGRLHITTLPDATLIQRHYARHSPGELPIELNVITDQEALSVGTQTFDGLGRRTALQVGPRLQQFNYVGGQAFVSEMITASHRRISYEYTPGLVSSPVRSVAPDEQSSFSYDEQSALLTLSQNTQGQHQFEYTATGQLRTERWTENTTGKEWQTVYSHTLAGRPLTRLDSNGVLSTYRYDDNTAKASSIAQGELIASFDYNNLGQTSAITTRNTRTGQTLRTVLTFDDQGRESERKMWLDDQPPQTLSQTYREDSKLRSRDLHIDGVAELSERYDYDPRGRMVEYRCEGRALPADRYGNRIAEQLFVFDMLDNVTEVYTRFADGSRNESLSTFAPDDRCQLVNVTHSHASHPASVTLDYDADGNLLHDEQGQTLNYDSQGRLLSVIDAQGKTVSQYRYDAHNHLLGVKRASQPETLHFYQGERLSRTEQGAKNTHYLCLNDLPLGQQEQGAPDKTLLLLVDSKNSVVAESDSHQLRQAAYGPYGERDADTAMQCLLGFNGEVCDELSGWYLLGRGYRAYNPTLMRFHSPDSLSPFGAGGVNPYVYCAGDPINFTDPTGHANRGINWKGFTGILLAIAGIAMSIAAVVIAPPVGALAIAAVVGFESVGLAFAGIGIADGIKATTATKLEDRERHASSSMTSGAFDVAFGAFGIFMAVRAAAKIAKIAKNAKVGPSQVAEVQSESNWGKHLMSSSYDNPQPAFMPRAEIRTPFQKSAMSAAYDNPQQGFMPRAVIRTPFKKSAMSGALGIPHTISLPHAAFQRRTSAVWPDDMARFGNGGENTTVIKSGSGNNMPRPSQENSIQAGIRRLLG